MIPSLFLISEVNVIRIPFVLTLIVYGGLMSQSRGGLGTTTGKEPGLWDQQNLIVARVTELRILDRKQDPQESTTHILILEPLVTLAGHLDPSQKSQIQARMAVARGLSWGPRKAPEMGALVLALIYPDDDRRNDKIPSYRVSNNACLFMPEEVGIVQLLRGLSDRRILETLARVRAARGTGSATRPTRVVPGDARFVHQLHWNALQAN